MKTVLFEDHGDPSVLQWCDYPDPVPQPHQVIIDIKAAAMNHLDLWVRRGIPGVPLPMIPGCDGAGIISLIGDEVTGFAVGDRVVIQPLTYCGCCEACKTGRENYCTSFGIFGESQQGTNCEKMAVDAKYVYKIPNTMDFSTAAAFPLVSETAYTMLIHRAKMKPGETVFIWGASSGVGHIAIQIAKVSDCTVITTAGNAEKEKFAKSLGADLVLNYQTQPVANVVKDYTNGKGVDIVFEHVGAATWKTSTRILGFGGRIVTCGATTGAKVDIDLRYIFFKQQSIIGSTMGSVAAFESMFALVAEGKITPHIGKTFQMSQIVEAHHYLEQGNQTGKVVLLT